MRRHSHLRTAALRPKRCPPTNAPHVAVQPPPQGRPSRGATHGVAQAPRTRKQRGPREMHSSRADTPPIMPAAEACPLSPDAPTPRRQDITPPASAVMHRALTSPRRRRWTTPPPEVVQWG
nr:unnamed protein product [Leishmania braziliensis]